MKKKLTIKDANRMSRDEFGEIMDILVDQIKKFQEDHNFKFDLVVPILRSGSIPATIIANACDIRSFLPLQYGYIGSEHIQLLSVPDLQTDFDKINNILICELNTDTGRTAKKAIKKTSELHPDAKIYYSTVSKVYDGPDTYIGIQKYFRAQQTNDRFTATNKQIGENQLRTGLTVFPRENAQQEIDSMNNVL